MGPGIRAVSQETPSGRGGPGSVHGGGDDAGGGAGQTVPSRTTPRRRSRALPEPQKGLPAEKPCPGQDPAVRPLPRGSLQRLLPRNHATFFGKGRDTLKIISLLEMG